MTRRHWIVVIVIIAIIFIGMIVWGFCYFPHFSNSLSGNNADWGNFGQFFFGLGTMLLAGLAAFIMLGIDTQLHRSNVISQYRKQLDSIINALITEKDEKKTKIAFLGMRQFMMMLGINNNFSKSIHEGANGFSSEFSRMNIDEKLALLFNAPKGAEKDEAIDIIGDIVTRLNSFQTDLVANKVLWPELLVPKYDYSQESEH